MKSAATTRRIIDALAELYPGATTELHYRTPFELLVATILSAQSTDAGVNMVTPTLFARYPDASALAAANAPDVEKIIVSTGFFRQKTKSIITAARLLVDHHGGEVPASMEALTTLSGVGRKTANVVLGHALGVPGLPVDRHVLRVANRIGIAEGDDPVEVESQLCARLPDDRWTLASDVLILHGRRVCKPKPLCDQCPLPPDCLFYQTEIKDARPKARKASPRRAARAPRKAR
jgi:endonuclease III